MKVNPNYVIKNVMGEVVLIPTGTPIEGFHGMISTNEVSGFILENLETTETFEEMLQKVLNEYEVSEEVARKDVYGFLENLRAIGIIANDSH